MGTTPPARNARRRRFRIAVVGVSAVVAVIGSVLLATRDSSEKSTTLGVTETLRVAGHPGAVVAGPDALWVALRGDSRETAGNERILRLDLATGAQAPSVELGGEVSHLARSGNRMIASVQHSSGLAELAILDWETGAVLTRHWYDGPVDQTVLRGKELWALKARPGMLLRLDPKTLDEISVQLPLSRGRTSALTSGGGYLWVTAADAGEVLRIDPATHAIKRAHIGGLPIGIVFTGGSVWVADRENGKVMRLDPASLLPVGKPIDVGARPSWLAAAAGSLFVTDQDDGTVARIDVHSGKKIGLPIRVGPSTRDAPAPWAAPAEESVWVSNFASSTLDRIASTAGLRVGEIKVVCVSRPDEQHPGEVTDGGLAGTGHFTASGAVSDSGKVSVYRTMKLPLITLRFVTSGRKGTITFFDKIDTNVGTSHWTITSATGAYKGLHGEGSEHESADFKSVQTLIGNVSS